MTTVTSMVPVALQRHAVPYFTVSGGALLSSVRYTNISTPNANFNQAKIRYILTPCAYLIPENEPCDLFGTCTVKGDKAPCRGPVTPVNPPKTVNCRRKCQWVSNKTTGTERLLGIIFCKDTNQQQRNTRIIQGCYQHAKM
eukprot:scaffold171749_cov39-Prasinocladus_malaysianus.AAC.2